jgi:hypothetical protein
MSHEEPAAKAPTPRPRRRCASRPSSARRARSPARPATSSSTPTRQGPRQPPPEAPGRPEGREGAEKLQAKAENEKVEREVKVRATRRGYLGHKIREEGDVFVIQLGTGTTSGRRS